MKIKDLPKIDLPREKLGKYGVKKLADYELLALLLGSGIKDVNVLELSKKVLKELADKGRVNIDLNTLLEIKGLGRAKASQIMAILELSVRLSIDTKQEVLSAEDVWKLSIDFRESKREHVVVFYLDTQNHLIEKRIVSIGTLDMSLVHPREIFEPALTLHSAGIIVVHNHPSGGIEPSDEDREVTKRLQESGTILGIAVIDHVIVSSRDWVSFKERKLL